MEHDTRRHTGVLTTERSRAEATEQRQKLCPLNYARAVLIRRTDMQF